MDTTSMSPSLLWCPGENCEIPNFIYHSINKGISSNRLWLTRLSLANLFQADVFQSYSLLSLICEIHVIHLKLTL